MEAHDKLPLILTRSEILSERARRHYWRGQDVLSVKTFPSGHAHYHVDGGVFRVDASSYLLLNHEQDYAVTIDSDTPTESFCVFFSPALVMDAFRSLNDSTATLLDNPFAGGIQPQGYFFQRTYPLDQAMHGSLNVLRGMMNGKTGTPPDLQFDEGLRTLLAYLFAAHNLARAEVDALPAARPATRDELYRRLHIARDTLAARFAESVTLEEIAHTAALSPNHLLRSFKALFGRTPHQFLIDERLRHAASLLRHSHHSITDICFMVGYQSVTSFSGLFRQRYGVSPDAYRSALR